jgi:hypothetical protein
MQTTEVDGSEFVHDKLEEEINAIGGHYYFTDEVRMPFQGREVLYLVGGAVFDRTCCGYTGFGYVLVPGYILDWKYKTNEHGLPVSRLEPVRSEDEREEIQTLIRQKESVQQVKFR